MKKNQTTESTEPKSEVKAPKATRRKAVTKRATGTKKPEATPKASPKKEDLTEEKLLEIRKQIIQLSLAQAEEDQDNSLRWDDYNKLVARYGADGVKKKRPYNRTGAKAAYGQFVKTLSVKVRSAITELSRTLERSYFESDAAYAAWTSRISGRFSRSEYVGLQTLETVAEFTGPLTTKDVELLAQPEGDEIEATGSGEKFQPMRYVAFASLELIEHLKVKGNSLATAQEAGVLKYHGCAFQNPNDETSFAMLPGSLFRKDTLCGVYHLCQVSRLFAMARQLMIRFNRQYPVWGWTIEEAADELNKLNKRQETREGDVSFAFATGRSRKSNHNPARNGNGGGDHTAARLTSVGGAWDKAKAEKAAKDAKKNAKKK